MVYVATENDSVYAFDADQQGPPLWQTSFIDTANGITPVPSTDLGTSCTDLVPIIGITATPVIDSTSGTLYVVSKVKLGVGEYQQQLHALDITTGLERANSPVTIAAQVAGTAPDAVKGVVSFDPLLQHDRAALTLANGVVYLTFASHCDIIPYHGWILGYDETTLAQEVVYNTTPNGSQGGIWESGCGPGVDTNGDLITITGNGIFDTSTPTVDYGDSFLRLTPGAGTLSVTSSFTPLDELMLEDEDLDMGSGGNLMFPVQPGPNPNLMIGAGKLGTIYLVNRDSMGGFNASTDQMVQELPGAVGGMFSTPAYWQGTRAQCRPAEHVLRYGLWRLPQDVRPFQWNDPDAAGLDCDKSPLASRARRRLSPPMAPPAVSCGRSIIRRLGELVLRFLMPSMQPTCRMCCTRAASIPPTIPDLR